MNSVMMLSVIAAVVLLNMVPSQGCPINVCTCGAPITLPLPLPATIPLGKVCTCNQIALAPTLVPASPCCPCPASPLALNPALLKKLLPLLASLSA